LDIILLHKNEEFIITGDFNGDLVRNKNKFDKTLSSFINKNNLKSCFESSLNVNAFTYSNSICNSLIDYIMIDKKSSISCKQCFIEYNNENTSDHNSINAKLNIVSNGSENKAQNKDNLTNDESNARNTKYRINWNSDMVVTEFYNFLEAELQKIKVNNIFNLDDNVETQNKVVKYTRI
jgi:hypothetical protein